MRTRFPCPVLIVIRGFKSTANCLRGNTTEDPTGSKPEFPRERELFPMGIAFRVFVELGIAVGGGSQSTDLNSSKAPHHRERPRMGTLSVCRVSRVRRSILSGLEGGRAASRAEGPRRSCQDGAAGSSPSTVLSFLQARRLPGGGAGWRELRSASVPQRPGARRLASSRVRKHR